MNSFCIFCTGGSTSEHLHEIKICEYKECPFYSFRFADISHEDEKEISLKLLGELGVKK